MGASAIFAADYLQEFAHVDPKIEVLAGLIRAHARIPIRRLLVVGCGSGVEAAILARALRVEVIGIDIGAKFDPRAAAAVDLRRGDATRLDFDDGSFDLAFSYHVLEHIPEYRKAIAEMHRVLKPQGTCCVGTPNRRRLVGYLGSREATTYEKIIWNFWDWKAMLLGRFRNELGAHAGFTSEELKSELANVFGEPTEITQAYYDGAYSRQAAAVRWLGRSGLGRFLFPAVYFVMNK
jgi:SAM-dependent methyltransferase